MPVNLVNALLDGDAGNLTIVTNDLSTYRPGGRNPVLDLIENGRVAKLVTSYPRHGHGVKGMSKVSVEVLPQGFLVEKIRAGGAGLVGVLFDYGEDRPVIARALRGNLSLIKGLRADTYNNITYQGTARNFNPVMATASGTCIAEVESICPRIDPEHVVTPGVYVDYVTVY
jgi:3-oxoadipate CoA-transferase alpha subunit